MTILTEQSIIPSMRAFSTSGVVVLIPAYNEERFIGSVVLQATQYADHVIVVDDGSSDKTAAVAASAGAYVLQHEKNQGKGIALNTGFRHASTLEPSVVVTIDADGQHEIDELFAVIDPVLHDDADIVIGSRYLLQTSSVPQHRAFNFITNQASRTSVTDSQSGFRAFSPQALLRLAFSSNGFSVESEMQFIAREHRLNLVDVPSTVFYHDAPKRSARAHKSNVLNGILKFVRHYRLLLINLPKRKVSFLTRKVSFLIRKMS